MANQVTTTAANDDAHIDTAAYEWRGSLAPGRADRQWRRRPLRTNDGSANDRKQPNGSKTSNNGFECGTVRHTRRQQQSDA
uniref:Uncharacterized protein n=1 Tax=Plectus sambesii TaxID=2011161 RepID=A0A914WHG1_9BILA